VQKLNHQDAAFLYSEKARAPMHLCSFHVYEPDPVTGVALSYPEFVEHVRSRLPLARVLRRRLERVPLDLDYPYWIEDRDFALDHHVHHVQLPEPGDWRALWDLAARLHAEPVDLRRPPWELYMIDGLDHVEGYAPGSFAMLIKIHHCAIDGISGIELMNALHDLDPDGRPEVVDTWRGEAPFGPLPLLGLALGTALQAPVRAAKFLVRSVPALGLRPTVRTAWTTAGGSNRPPASRLNQRVTTNRVGNAMVLDLDQVKRVRREVPGATVNDVLLAVVGGGIRAYLRSTDDLPEPSLQAGVPVSMRTDDDAGAAGNKIAMMRVELGTDIEGARDRLAAVVAATSASKELTQAVEARVMTESAELLPGALLGLAVRANALNTARGTASLIGNVCVTNVPGSQAPLYLRGSMMRAYYSLGPVYDNAGPIHLVVSYLGKIYLSVTTCREIVPDIEQYVACLRRSWEELQAETLGADEVRSTAPRRPPSGRRRRRAG
jgi:WS/DGAT/MGAT family acyltransferase